MTPLGPTTGATRQIASGQLELVLRDADEPLALGIGPADSVVCDLDGEDAVVN